MRTHREIARASGYLLMFLPPTLLALEVALGIPGLAFLAIIGCLPFLRVVFGDSSDEQQEWSEGAATALERLPDLFAVTVVAAICYVLWQLHAKAMDVHGMIWLGGSLWAVLLSCSCAAHELLHRRNTASQVLGRILSGTIGYPLQEHEHRAHHRRNSNIDEAESPRLDESLWAFTLRRSWKVFRTAWDGNAIAAAKRGKRLTGGLPLAVFSTLATAVAFAWAGGAADLALYGAVVASVFWSVQAMTYIQHWGLGSDSVPDALTGNYAWEDLCWLQSRLTLNISYHQGHHHASSVPYYRRHPLPGSPKAPAGYVVLLIASMVPPLWRRLMLPALQQWRHAPDRQQTGGRKLVCFARSCRDTSESNGAPLGRAEASR